MADETGGRGGDDDESYVEYHNSTEELLKWCQNFAKMYYPLLITIFISTYWTVGFSKYYGII